MNTTVGHKLLFHLMASKEAVFVKAAFGSLDASGEITLRKLDLNFLYRAGSCFAAASSSWLERRPDIRRLLLLNTSSDKDQGLLLSVPVN